MRRARCPNVLEYSASTVHAPAFCALVKVEFKVAHHREARQIGCTLLLAPTTRDQLGRSPNGRSKPMRLICHKHIAPLSKLANIPIRTSAHQQPRYAMSSAPLQLAPLSGVEAAKRAAAYAAVDAHVGRQDRIIGIGSGSTVPYVVERIVQQGKELNSGRIFLPTGFQSKELIVSNGLQLGDVDCHPIIDVTIDGADEVDPQLNAIKGGGACHLREKVLAEAAKTFIVVADYRKNSDGVLGTAWTQGVPVEAAEFAYSKVMRDLTRLGGKPVLRMGKAKAGPVVTDNG